MDMEFNSYKPKGNLASLNITVSQERLLSWCFSSSDADSTSWQVCWAMISCSWALMGSYCGEGKRPKPNTSPSYVIKFH